MPLDVYSSKPSLLLVTGMAKEARIASGPGSVTIESGSNATRLRQLLAARDEDAFRAVVSFGIAGGLDPTLRPGHVIIADGIAAGGRSWPAQPVLAEQIRQKLAGEGGSVSLGRIAGSDTPILSGVEKGELRAETGAAAVDMESHVAAQFAQERGIPFAAIRVVCDPAERNLPLFVLTALRPDGEVDIFAVLRSLSRRPGQIGPMLSLARDSAAAFRSLRRCGDLLGIGGGLPDLVQLLGDVA